MAATYHTTFVIGMGKYKFSYWSVISEK